MPNIATVLKEEITRLVRKQLRGETENLKKAVSHYRTEIVALKRRLAMLERQQGQLNRRVAKSSEAKATSGEPTRMRFSPKGFKSHRERLGLSAGEMGKLIGVSGQTIYNWEAGTTKPREGQLAAIAAIRTMGKRAVMAKLSSEQQS